MYLYKFIFININIYLYKYLSQMIDFKCTKYILYIFLSRYTYNLITKRKERSSQTWIIWKKKM